MIFDSASLLRRLQKLQQHIVELPRHGESMRVALDGCDLQAAICATLDAERHIRALVVTAEHIKAQVVPADGLGAAPESLSELVLRAVRMVVLTELGSLRDVVCKPSAHVWSRALSWGQFQGIEDLTSCVGAELDRITCPWSGCRGMQGIERAAYRAALRAAHASMRQLGDASEFARFLREGRTRTDWPALRKVCTRMLVALTIRIDVDPDLPLLVVARLIHARAAERAP